MNRKPSDLDWLLAFSLVSILQQEKRDFQCLGSSPVPARAELCWEGLPEEFGILVPAEPGVQGTMSL